MSKAPEVFQAPYLLEVFKSLEDMVFDLEIKGKLRSATRGTRRKMTAANFSASDFTLNPLGAWPAAGSVFATRKRQFLPKVF
jgi:hypothetical protein